MKILVVDDEPLARREVHAEECLGATGPSAAAQGAATGAAAASASSSAGCCREQQLNLVLVLRCIERMADHAVNVSQRVARREP